VSYSLANRTRTHIIADREKFPRHKTRCGLNRRTSFGYTTAALTTYLTLAACSGCARGVLASIFVEHDSPGEVVMLRLVESPPGRLSGSLVISSLNSDGSRKKDAVYDVTGSISGSNVSLQLQGATFGRWLGAPSNLVGSLSGGVLTLSLGNDTSRLQEMSEKRYEAELANLDSVGQHMAMVERAKNAMQEVKSSDQRLNADLKVYIGWGEQRIDHVPVVRRWYADRIDRYTKCLQTIRPLAAAGVPSWRWQDCVLAIENDEYDRGQEAGSIRDAQSQNQQSIASLDARINAAQQQFPKALDAMNSGCPFTKDVGACTENVRKLHLLLPNGFLDSKLVTDYRSIVPQVNAAISADVQISASGESTLSSIAQQVERMYQSAR
jgi:hypothetical protein